MKLIAWIKKITAYLNGLLDLVDSKTIAFIILVVFFGITAEAKTVTLECKVAEYGENYDKFLIKHKWARPYKKQWWEFLIDPISFINTEYFGLRSTQYFEIDLEKQEVLYPVGVIIKGITQTHIILDRYNGTNEAIKSAIERRTALTEEALDALTRGDDKRYEKLSQEADALGGIDSYACKKGIICKAQDYYINRTNGDLLGTQYNSGTYYVKGMSELGESLWEMWGSCKITNRLF